MAKKRVKAKSPKKRKSVKSKVKTVKRKVKTRSLPKKNQAKKIAAPKTTGAKKHSVHKPVKKVVVAKKPVQPALPLVGKIIHYYDHISVGVVHVEKPLRVNDRIRIGKNDQFFEQDIKSMQVNRQPITEAKKGQEIGLKVKKRVRQNDLVWKV